jgi:hypothetical protein
MLAGIERHGRLGLRICSLLMPLFAAGCMNRQLEFTTRRTLNTLPDLHYQQIIDNLAAVASNPGRLPYLAVVGQGSIQVTENGNAALGLSITPGTKKPGALGLSASENITGNWSLGTITSPDKIRSMQAVYQRAVAASAVRDPAYLWLNVGGKRDVPARATHAGRHGETAVWVMPEGVAGLSELALEILDIATREDAVPASSSPPDSLHRPSIPRRNFQVPATGPVYTPGKN